MRKITKNLICMLLLLMAGLSYSQKVAVIGINHTDPDGFSFVVTDNAGLANGEVIYFTENEYDNAANNFIAGESVIQFTAGSAIAKGNVVYVQETGTPNTYTVTCTGGGCGTAVNITGSFATGSAGEAIYAYSDSDSDPGNGVTTIHSVLFAGEGTQTGGSILASMDPSGDYPTAIVVDGFPNVAPNRVEFTPTTPARTNVSKVALENPSNYVHAQTNAALSVLFFTNLNLAGSNPVVTVTASPASVLENSGTGMVYTFSISPTSVSATTVNFSVSGSATFGIDYSQSGAASFNTTAGSITIPANTASASMTLTPTGDLGLEPHESIVITITSGSGYDAGSPGAATTMINNEDTTNNEPMVALVGISHTDPDAFSFVATKDIPASTVIYFTDNSFNNNTLLFGSGEAVIRWTSPASTLLKGNVVVVTETAPDVLSVTCSGGTCGTITLMSGNFATSTVGETMYAYTDNDADPSNGVTDVYAVLYTGSVSTGGNIPSIEDPSTVFHGALVVDGFPTTPAPARTEYDPAGRNVLVTDVIFENPSNWVFGQASPALSTTPFANINVIDSTPPDAICQNISVTPVVGTGSVTITASQIDNGSTDNVGIASISVSPDTFTCANIGTPVTVTLTVTDTSGNSDTCTATVTVLPNDAPTFTQVGPVCEGDTITLPTTSNNGIAGTWSPAIDNTQTTTYTFTPTQTRCGALVTMTVVVNSPVTPTFTQVGPVCAGDAITLPTTSNNTITGAWSPTIDNTQTTLYTFTPDAGQCATTATMTVVVDQPTVPTFTPVAPTCAGDAFILPVTSNNNITGTWSPAIDTMQTTLYTFTPDAGQCATTTTMSVTVNPLPATPVVVNSTPICDGGSFHLSASNHPPASYNMNTNSGVAFIDISATGTSITGLGDDSEHNIIMPSFPFNGNIYTTARVGNNGLVALGSTGGDIAFGNGSLPSNLNSAGNTFLAPYWDDLFPAGGTTITTQQIGNLFIIQYTLSSHYSSSGNITFQAQLDRTTGVIHFVYQDVIFGNPSYDSGISATIGIQMDLSNAVQYSFDTASLVDGQSITFTPNLPYTYSWSGPNGFASTMPYPFISNASAADNGDYHLVITDPVSNCSSAQGTVTVTVNPVLTPTFDPIPAQTCGSGSPLPGTSTNGVNGTWSPAYTSTPGTTTTYTFTPSAGQCATTATASVTIDPAPGDPSVFGNNEWTVYAYNAGNSQDTGTSWNTNYSGYYTIGTLGFDTRDQWSDGGSPSQAAGYQGCPVGGDNHSWSAKRRGFPAAVYSIDIPTHDDEAELWINGVMVWEDTACCDSHTAVWQGNLGAFDTVEYRVTEGGGGSNGVIAFNILPFGSANLTGTYCGATISSNAVTLVSNYVIGAQTYRFRVRHGVSGAVVGIVDRPVNSFALSNMPGITLATTYVIDVMVRVNNVWQPFYGSPCTVTTPTPAATIGAQCGTVLSSMGQWIYATYQPTVTAYRFRITNLTTSQVLEYNPVNGLNKFNFNQLPASFRSTATTYSVEVALRNTDGTYLPYGAACNVTTPMHITKEVLAVPSTEFVAIAYPNPYAENFMFDVKTSAQSTINIRVYDMLGKQIENRNVEAADISATQFGDMYPSGVYNVILSQGENTQTLRVIKR